MSREEDAADITPYDLAERIISGQFTTSEAAREVAEELLRLRDAWKRVGAVLEDRGCDCDAHPDELESDDWCVGHAVQGAWENRPAGAWDPAKRESD